MFSIWTAIRYNLVVELPARFEENIRRHQLLDRGARFLLAISGGVDSMVLLHLLNRAARTHQWSFAIAHFNHCLRGTQSDGDVEFVQSTAATLNVPFHAAAGDVRAHAGKHGLSIEMASRELRHRFLIETARNLNLPRVVLAHHADDQIETFWLRLLRGDIGAGLGGMRWIRRASGDPPLDFVRPLLNVAKAELLAYATDHQVAFREDASNREPEFLRNRLRLEILPLLEKFQPALRETSLRAAEVIALEKSFLEFEARRWLASRDAEFASLHRALQREVVRLQLLGLGVRPSFDIIEKLRADPGVPISTSANQTLLRTAAGQVQFRPSQPSSFIESQACAQLTAEGHITFEDVEFRWSAVPARETSSPGVEYFDFDRIGGEFSLRHWRPGDRFHPIGLGHHAKLQDLFTNLKVDAVEKRRRIIAADKDGNLFWVEGLRISEHHKVTPQTARVLKWTWRRKD